jgi:hypothetical protein
VRSSFPSFPLAFVSFPDARFSLCLRLIPLPYGIRPGRGGHSSTRRCQAVPGRLSGPPCLRPCSYSFVCLVLRPPFATRHRSSHTMPYGAHQVPGEQTLTVRKEDNSFRIIVRERSVDGAWPSIPDPQGTPALLLYAPMAEIKIRSLEVSYCHP